MYINGMGCVSRQEKAFCKDYISVPAATVNSEFFKCAEPDYREYLDPAFSRRLGRMTRYCMVSAIIALKEAGISNPNAIIAATGLGCIEDTEKFLSQVLENKAGLLAPASFIYSTHNTVSSQLALYLKCNGYNITYSHRIFSFSLVLEDARMYLDENKGSNILCGGFDEITGVSNRLLNKVSGELNGIIDCSRIIRGEGASFFVVSNEKFENSSAEIVSSCSFRSAGGKAEIQSRIDSFLDSTGSSLSDISLVFAGMTGNGYKDREYINLKNGVFNTIPFVAYKKYSGDYFTSSAFATWSAANILKNQSVPENFMDLRTGIGEIQSILILDIWGHKDYSMILLRRC